MPYGMNDLVQPGDLADPNEFNPMQPDAAPAGPGAQFMQMNPDQLIPADVRAALTAKPMTAWDAVPASNRVFGAVGMTPEQAMTGGSRDTFRNRGATGAISRTLAGDQAARSRSAQLAGEVLRSVLAPLIHEQGQVAAAMEGGEADVRKQRMANQGALQVEQQRGQTAALQSLVQLAPEVANILGLGPDRWQPLGNGGIFQPGSGQVQQPPSQAPEVIYDTAGNALGMFARDANGRVVMQSTRPQASGAAAQQAAVAAEDMAAPASAAAPRVDPNKLTPEQRRQMIRKANSNLKDDDPALQAIYRRYGV